MPGLSGRPLHLSQTNPLLVFAYSLVDVAFEPGLFGCHLRPHDAPARACAYWSRNPHVRILAFSECGSTSCSFPGSWTCGGSPPLPMLCPSPSSSATASHWPRQFRYKISRDPLWYPTAFEFRVIVAGLGEDLEQVCDMNFGYCWFWWRLSIQVSKLRRPTSLTTMWHPSYWCRLWYRVLDRGRCHRLKITVEDHSLRSRSKA